MIFTNSNAVELVSGTSANITLTSGATVDLTGNTNATPIAPGGLITFESGGATVLTGATAGVAAKTTTVDGTLVQSIGNDGTITFDGYLRGTASISNAIIKSKNNVVASYTNIYTSVQSVYSFHDCIIDCLIYVASSYGGGILSFSGNCEFNNFIGATGSATDDIVTVEDGTQLTTGSSFPSNINYVMFSHDLRIGTGCTINGILINGGTAGTFANSKIYLDGTVSN